LLRLLAARTANELVVTEVHRDVGFGSRRRRFRADYAGYFNDNSRS
jgi:hypothetical protein